MNKKIECNCVGGCGTCREPDPLPFWLQSVERPAVVKTAADDDEEEAVTWGRIAAKLDEALGRPAPPPAVIDDDDDGAGGLIWGQMAAKLDEALRPPLSAVEIRERELDERLARERQRERQREQHQRQLEARRRQARATGDPYAEFLVE